MSEVGCGLWFWHSLDFSIYFLVAYLMLCIKSFLVLYCDRLSATLYVNIKSWEMLVRYSVFRHNIEGNWMPVHGITNRFLVIMAQFRARILEDIKMKAFLRFNIGRLPDGWKKSSVFTPFRCPAKQLIIKIRRHAAKLTLWYVQADSDDTGHRFCNIIKSHSYLISQ